MSMPTDLAYFYPAGHDKHTCPGHVERPERVEAIRNALQSAGWWDPFPKLEPILIPEPVLYAVHDSNWYTQLKQYCSRYQYIDINTFVTAESYDLALNAAGGTAAVASVVWRGAAKRGFSLARPPGHHATRKRGGGFCLLNNVALAVETIHQEFGAQRLAIIDFDLHHGNGTQDIFWQRGDVFYISTHQMPLFPGTGWITETGEGAGKETKANFPLPPGSGDLAFGTILDELIMPLLDRFLPEMIFISFGFDSHWLDPLGSLLLSAGQYRQLIATLKKWTDNHCSGRLVIVLEGGYDLMAAAACSLAVTSALLDIPWDDSIGPAPYAEDKGWQKMVVQAKRVWRL